MQIIINDTLYKTTEALIDQPNRPANELVTSVYGIGGQIRKAVET